MTIANTEYTMVAGGVTTQYDQKIVRLNRRSNASPEAACVIWASVRAGGDEASSTRARMNTGLCDAYPRLAQDNNKMRVSLTLRKRVVCPTTLPIP